MWFVFLLSQHLLFFHINLYINSDDIIKMKKYSLEILLLQEKTHIMKNKKHVFTKNISLLCLSGLFIIFPISLHQNMSIKNEVPSIESESINGLVTEFDLGGNSSSLTLDTIDNGYVDTVYMWGNNEFGQLAFADNTNYNIPTEHPFSGGVALVDLEQGSRHSGTTLDVNANGEANYLYMWGANESGQLGLGSEQSDDYYNTAQWSTYIPDGNYINLELGDDDSGVTIDTTGDKKADSLYMWGANESGQLGLGDNTNYDTPQEVPLPEGEIIDFELGFQHSAVTIDTTNDGEADSLYMWGDNSYGQLGNGTVDSGVNTPEQLIINSSGDFIDLTLDANSSSMTVDTIGDGKADSVYVWGANESGQLGLGDNGTNNTYNSPTELTTLPNGTIIDFEIGTSHSGATIDTLGDGVADSLYMWGANDSGQLGLGDNINYDTPQEVNLDEIGIPYDLQLGNYHTGLTVDTTGDGNINSLYMWGANESGQLGLGDNVDYNTPQNIGFDITPPPELPSVNDTAIVSDINSTSATINYSFSPGNDEFGNPYAVTNITLAGTGITDNYTVETPASPMGTILLEDLELNTTYDDLIVSTTFSDGNTYDQNVDSFITSEIVPVTPPSPNDTATVADIDTTTATINYSFDSGSDENGDPYAVTEITLVGTGITNNYTVESPTSAIGTITLQDLELNTIYDDLIVLATFTDGNTYEQDVDSFTTLAIITNPSPNETATVSNIIDTNATVNYSFSPGNDEFGNPYEVTQITLTGTGITDNYTVKSPTSSTGKITLQDLDPETNYNDLIVSITFADGNTYQQNVDEFTTQ
ncbi:MAG: hypothetical protein GQ557_01220, partial [Mycoplasmataceae bacterium]|nr:hypothetical protein [Mycoplasmataceae bacterium]